MSGVHISRYLNGNNLSKAALRIQADVFPLSPHPGRLWAPSEGRVQKATNPDRKITIQPQEKRQRRWKHVVNNSLRWKVQETRKCSKGMLRTMCFILPAPTCSLLSSVWSGFQWTKLHQDTVFMQLPCSPCAALRSRGDTKKGQKPFCALWSMLVAGWLLNNSKMPKGKGTCIYQYASNVPTFC